MPGVRAIEARQTLRTALALALGAAVSLGLARFSYALLLPPMRADLGWSYLTAGLMNTVNAAGYLAGALATPWLLGRADARTALLGGSVAAALALGLHCLARADVLLYLLRFATGVASAAVFVSGGLLAARLAGGTDQKGPYSSGLLLGIYYGGTGLGIVACAGLVPPLTQLARSPSLVAGWQWAWLALGVLALVATAVMALGVPRTAATAATQGLAARADRLAWGPLAPGLGGYFMFGLGYIGYMTFIVTLLREQQLSTGAIVAFYSLLGLGVMVSPWLWAGLLQRQKGGGALALLNGLLAVATVIPVLWTHPVAAFASGALFGAVFLSVVASTTALVRHNLPAASWPAGISVFTVVFAAGQIVGPTLVGRLSDALGGLRIGLAVSAAVLLTGALLAAFQKPLPTDRVAAT